MVSGAGSLFLNGQPLGIAGHEPVWRDADRIVFHTDRPERGTWQVDLRELHLEPVKLSDLELIELAGGGGEWAGVQPGVGVHTSWGELIRNAGQPNISDDVRLIYRVGDDRIEPSISRTAAAWGDGRGGTAGQLHTIGIPRDLAVVPPEYRPRVFDTPEGPWLLTMTHTTLRLRPFGSREGYERKTGDNHNLHADVIYADGQAKVAYQNDRGVAFLWLQDLSAIRKPFGEVFPQPPKPEPDMPAEVPNLKHVVERVRTPYPTPLDTQHAAFLAEVVFELRQASKLNIGLLKKAGGFRIGMPSGITVASDIVTVHQGTELWTYDILGSSEKEAKPAWNRTKPTGVEKDTSKFYDVRPSDFLEPPAPDEDDEDPPPPDTPTDEATTLHLLVRLGRHLGAWV